MRESNSIRNAYWETEKHFIDLVDFATISNDKIASLRLQEMSKINENAYFVLFWGQFEAFINDKVVEIENSALEMGFMSRVRLAILPEHEYYQDIDKYYTWRCKLAHGEAAKLQSLILSSIFDKVDEIVDTLETCPLPLGDSLFDLFSENTDTRE